MPNEAEEVTKEKVINECQLCGGRGHRLIARDMTLRDVVCGDCDGTGEQQYNTPKAPHTGSGYHPSF